VTRSGPRCPRHTRQRPAWPHRKDAAARGMGWAWTNTRRKILARDTVCTICRRMPATTVDHITPRSAGGTDDPANLRGVCKPCHAEKTKRESAAGRRASRS
jgi:5-methylcytosine-specific restriction endonuclease McrA